MTKFSKTKAYVINLDRRPDRLAEISYMLSQLGIEYQRISAIDGKSEDMSQHGQWLKAFAYNGFEPPNLAQAAVFSGHRRVWQDLLDSQSEQAIVFEDDAICDAFDPKFLALDLAHISLDQLRLERLSSEAGVNLELPGCEDIKVMGRRVSFARSYGAAAYLVSREGARKMLEIGSFWFNIDHFDMWRWVGGLRTGILEPPLFKQSDSPSDIAANPNKLSDQQRREPSHAAAWQYLTRAETLLVKGLRQTPEAVWGTVRYYWLRSQKQKH